MEVVSQLSPVTKAFLAGSLRCKIENCQTVRLMEYCEIWLARVAEFVFSPLSPQRHLFHTSLPATGSGEDKATSEFFPPHSKSCGFVTVLFSPWWSVRFGLLTARSKISETSSAKSSNIPSDSAFYCPQSFSGGGLYLNGSWLLWSVYDGLLWSVYDGLLWSMYDGLLWLKVKGY